MKKINKSEVLDVEHILLAKRARDHINAYRYLNWLIEPEVLLLILHKKLWKRWGYSHPFLALRIEAGLGPKSTKLFMDYIEEEEKKSACKQK